MKRSALCVVALIVVAGCASGPSPCATSAQPNPAVASAVALPNLEARLDQLLGADLNGAALLAKDGEILYAKGFGMADAASNRPNSPGTRFRLASITKQFTAMAILILESRGLLDRSDSICDNIDDCPEAWKAVTIEHLLDHTSGIANYTDQLDFDGLTVATPAQTVAGVADIPLTWEPGESFSYTNTGHVLLGMVIERVSGKPYATFLQEEIFGPLGMQDSGYEDGDTPGLATGYSSDFRVADPLDMSVPYAAGGLYSTVLDLNRWQEALYTERLARSIHTEIPTRRGRRGRLAVPICTAALLAGSPPDNSPSPIPVDAVTALLRNDPEAWFPDMDRAAWQQLRQDATSVPWKMVSAAGVEQAAACIGQGAPTVVYLNGFDTPAAPSWSQAAVAQSESNRVCMFDRPEMGLSSGWLGAGDQEAPEQHAQEMLAMLQVLGEPGPYLLTGWSYGGLVARTAAAQHPAEVAGMVLVDATSPLQQPINDGTIVDDGTIALPSVGEGPDMGNQPVIVLQAERTGWWPPGGQSFVAAPEHVQKNSHDLQLQAATISDNSLHAVVDESFHDIPIRHPAAVVAATTAVAESIRAGNSPLPPCPDDLIAAGVTCTTG